MTKHMRTRVLRLEAPRAEDMALIETREEYLALYEQFIADTDMPNDQAAIEAIRRMKPRVGARAAYELLMGAIRNQPGGRSKRYDPPD